MTIKGIRISDKKDGKCIPLCEILANIPDPNQLKWSLLWLDVTPINGKGKYILELQNEINQSKQGFPCSFNFLVEVSSCIFQEIELLIIGCKTKENLIRYDEDQKMYENCDIVLEMIDGGCWEIFSMNAQWINELSRNYEYIENLKTDFQKDQPDRS